MSSWLWFRRRRKRVRRVEVPETAVESDLAKLARSLGWQHTNGAGSIAPMPFSLLSAGFRRQIGNVLSGPYDGVTTALFELSYDTRTARDDHDELVRVRSDVDRRGTSSGRDRATSHASRGQGLRFDNSDFMREYEVTSAEEACARAVLDAPMLDWLTMPGTPPYIEVSRAYVFAATEPTSVLGWRALAEWLHEFRGRLPREALTRYPAHTP